jgi:hypothetical protein
VNLPRDPTVVEEIVDVDSIGGEGILVAAQSGHDSDDLPLDLVEQTEAQAG